MSARRHNVDKRLDSAHNTRVTFKFNTIVYANVTSGENQTPSTIIILNNRLETYKCAQFKTRRMT